MASGMIEFDRNQGIGGSDVPVICGMSPYRSAIDLWDEKRGNAIPREETLRQTLGKMLEDGIAKVYAQQEGAKLRKRKYAYGLVTNRDRTALAPDEWLEEKFGYPTWAQIDRDRVGHQPLPGEPVIRGVEIKHTAQFDRFSGDLPDDVAVQVQHALMLTGWPAMHVVSLSAGRDLKIDTVIADPDTHEAIAEACRVFWRQVQTGEEPEPDGSDAAGRYIRRKYNAVEPDKIVVATHDALPMIAEVLRLAAVKKEAERELEAAKQGLMLYMGDAERLDAPGDVKITWKQQQGRTDYKAIAHDLRAVLEAGLVDSLQIGDGPALPIADALDFIESMHKGEPTRVFRVTGKAVAL